MSQQFVKSPLLGPSLATFVRAENFEHGALNFGEDKLVLGNHAQSFLFKNLLLVLLVQSLLPYVRAFQFLRQLAVVDFLLAVLFV